MKEGREERRVSIDRRKVWMVQKDGERRDIEEKNGERTWEASNEESGEEKS